MGKKESKKRNREATTNNRQQQHIPSPSKEKSSNKVSRSRSSPHGDMNIVECFGTVLDKCASVSENFRKAKIVPICEAFEEIKEKDTLVTFVAETGFGKSRMVNAIVGLLLCPERESGEVFSCTMLPMIIRHGNRIELQKKTFSGDSKNVYFDSTTQLCDALNRCNQYVKDAYKKCLGKNMSLEQDPVNKPKPTLDYDYLEVFFPSAHLQAKKLQIIDFPGMTHEEVAPLIRDHNRSMSNHLVSEGKTVDAIFIGCHRNAKNPFLAPHEHERKLIDWYGFLTRENIIHTPCICLVDNTWEREIQPTVARLTSLPKFEEYLREQFIACITGTKPQRISKQALEEVGIASFGEEYAPIFSSFYSVQFYTLYRKTPDSLIPIMRKLFSYIDVHDAPEKWMNHFDTVIDKARSNSIQSKTRELFKQFNSVLQNTKKYRPLQFSTEEGAGTHAILNILRKSKTTKTTQEDVVALFLNYCQSEDLDVEWNDTAEGSNESWEIFVSAFVDRFLFSNASGALIFLHATILFERFQEKTINFFVHELNKRVRNLRFEIDWLEDLQRPRPTWFTTQLEAVFRDYATIENIINPSPKNPIFSFFKFFHLKDRISDIYKVVNAFTDEFAKGITADVAREMNIIRKDIKPYTSQIMQLIITEEFGRQIIDDDDDDARIDHSLRLRRFEPGAKATNFLAYCPSNFIKADLNFNSNAEVQARYEELKKKKVFPSTDKFHRDAIFFRKHDPNAYQMANLVEISVLAVPTWAVEARPIKLDHGNLHLNVIHVHINMEIKQVEVPEIAIELYNRTALVFIPTYFVANNDTQLRKVNYFLESIVDSNDALSRDPKIGPFIVIVEQWQLDIVLNEIQRQLSKLRENNYTYEDIERAMSNHFHILCVHNRHIGVGRARDLCRLMAVHLNAKHFFVLHDDVQSIVEMMEGGTATYKDPVVPIRGLRCMVDVLETEYLDFRSNMDKDARVDMVLGLEDQLKVSRRELNHSRALADIVDVILETPGLLRIDGSLDDYLKSNFNEQYMHFANLTTVICSAFDNTCNKAICQVALLSAERQKELLNDASKRRANGYTHALSSMLYECTLYRTEPCKCLSFLSGDAFFDDESEENYQCFRDFVKRDKFKEFMPIRGWDRTKIPDDETDDEASRDEYYGVLNHSIRYGYRYEDHAFHERLMLRGYTGVVLYNYQMVPFDKQASAVFERDSVVADTGSINAYDDDDSEDGLYLSEL